MDHLNKGMFYGVGVGPGDPELLTLKARRILEASPVIAAPQTKNGGTLALDIARKGADLTGKTILPLAFTMARAEKDRVAAHEAAADAIASHLDRGEDVAMVTLGDVTIYATPCYVAEILTARGYAVTLIPGVPSFSAGAAALGMSLTSPTKPLHILPAQRVEESLSLPGTKVIMKAGSQLPKVTAALEERGLLDKAALFRDCGLESQELYPDITQAPDQGGYFVTVIVKE